MKIIDEKIKPYLIDVNNGNYDVLEDTFKTNKKGERIFKTHGHFSNTERALNKILKLIVEQDNNVYTIKGYIDELKKTKLIINN